MTQTMICLRRAVTHIPLYQPQSPTFGTTSPRYIKQQAMYFPWRGSHLVIMFVGSNTELVISATDKLSWNAFSPEITGAYDVNKKWIRGYGTKLVWKKQQVKRYEINDVQTKPDTIANLKYLELSHINIQSTIETKRCSQ